MKRFSNFGTATIAATLPLQFGAWLPEIATTRQVLPWLIIAFAGLLLGISALLLARLRIVQSRPLAVCAVLSILAHLLLVLAVQFLPSFDAPGDQGDSQITMHLIDEGPPVVADSSIDQVDADVEPPEPTDPAPLTEAPALLAEDSAKSDEQTPDPDLHEADALPEEAVAPDDSPPMELIASEPEPSPEPTPSEPDTLAAEDAEPPPNSDVEPEIPVTASPTEAPIAEADLDTKTPPELAWRQQEPRASGDMGALPKDVAPPQHANQGKFPHRNTAERERLLANHGGSSDTEDAARRGLRWLAQVQERDGSWSARAHGAGQGGFVEGQDRTGTGLRADSGITGLALLAFLGAGHGNGAEEFDSVVQRGADFLVTGQSPDGNLAATADPFARMYCHGIATLALGEAVGVTSEPRYQTALQKAIQYSMRTQHATTGGWRYRPGEDGDTSQFGWQVMALVSGRNAGARITTQSLTGCGRFLRVVSSGAHGGLAAYRPFHPPSPTMTAEALVCRLMLDEATPQAIDEATRYILIHPPGSGAFNPYYDYYGSLALHLSGADWQSWNQAMLREIIPRQHIAGRAAGSWSPDPIWGQCGGRIYTSAMSILCLEVYYRHLPIVQRQLARHPSFNAKP